MGMSSSSARFSKGHFAYANSLYPDMVPAMLAAKLLGDLLGGVIAMLATRNLKENL